MKPPISLSEIVPHLTATVLLDSMLFLVADDYAIGFVRAHLVQKVALRHRMKLKENSLNILAWGDMAGGWSATVKSLASKLLSPWTYLKEKFDPLSWGEETGRTFALGVLLDLYLSINPRKTLSNHDAKKIRQAIDQALLKTSVKFPPVVLEKIKQAGSELAKELLKAVLPGSAVQKGVEAKKRGPSKNSDDHNLKNKSSLEEASREIVTALVHASGEFSQQLQQNFDVQQLS